MSNRYIISGLLALTTSLMLSTGCKEDTIIKASVAPGNNSLGTVSVADTFTVITKSVYIDTLNSSEKITGLPVVQALGTFVDPYFGTTNAGIYFQVLPTGTNTHFAPDGVDYTIDSAVLILPYSGFSWGNRSTPKPQKFKVFRVDQYMDPTATYYSNQDQPIQSQPIGEATVDLLSVMTDTPTVLGNNSGYRHIRIPLSNDFINDINSHVGDAGAYGSDENFLNFLKGFYVMPDTSANLAASADLLTYILLDGGSDYSRAAVAFYFHEKGSTESKTVFFNFNRDKNLSYSRITRNYEGYPVKTVLDNSAATPGQSDDILVLQNEPGACIDVRIPYISSLPVSSILKAELVFTSVSSGTAADSLPSPSRLTLVGIADSDGSEYEINDFNANDITAAVAFVDGTRRTEQVNGKEVTRYRINIPRELQRAINDSLNELHLRIKGAKSFPAAYRFVAGGRTNSTYNTQLNIVYSKPK